MAGGLGTRLRPLTEETPKPMVNVLGKPFLEYVIGMLKEKGFDKFVICSSYKNEKIRDYFGNGSKFGVTIGHSVEATPLGTAGAIRNALFYLEGKFMVINGDTYLDIDYSNIYEKFGAKKEAALMVLYSGKEIKERVDNVSIDGNGLVTSFDKGNEMQSKYGWAGVLLLMKSAVEKWSPRMSLSLEKDVFPGLIEKGLVDSFITKTKYYDIGTAEKLNDFTQFIMGKKIKPGGD